MKPLLILALAPFAVVALALLVVASPLVLVYFLFHRLCCLIEDLKTPNRKGKRRGRGMMANLPSILKLASPRGKSHNKQG